jgi:lipoprotein-releasing system permease protein
VFNILSSLIMLVRAKTRDIAILRTMGATRRGHDEDFVTVGVTSARSDLLGLSSAPFSCFFRQGVVNGSSCHRAEPVGSSIRFLTDCRPRRPVRSRGDRAHRLGLSFLATLYPAWKAASTDPVQVLRYE